MTRRYRKSVSSFKPHTKVKLAETDLAKFVVTHLHNEGWEVYQEVQIKSYGAVADIIAVKNDEVMVVETKTSFGLSVLSQAHHWKKHAHYSAIAVPRSQSRTKARSFGQLVARKFGIGVFVVSPMRGVVTTRIQPEKNPGANTKKILEVLTERHKTYAQAGSAKGQHLTPFKMTCEDLAKLVLQQDGICLEEAVTLIKHHYKNNYNAMRSIAKQIQFGNVPNLVAEWDGKKKCLRLYYCSKTTSPFPPRRKPLEASAKTEL